MKALILNGSAPGDVTLQTVHKIVEDELLSIGWDVDSFILHEEKIAGCLGCFGCWAKTPGICVINDAGRAVATASIRCDLLILLTPVTFGGYSSELKKAMDRLIPNLSPFFIKIHGEVHHRPRYDRYPSFFGIGLLPDQDVESERIFRELVRRNAVNYHSPVHGACTVYRTQPPEEMRSEMRIFFNSLKTRRSI
jgi:hypothetical protein